MPTSDFEHEHEQHKPKRLTFDPTINAGHVLTFVTMVALWFAAWSALDKRVVVLEEAKAYQTKRDDAQDNTINEKLTEIKETIKDVRHGIDELRRDQRGGKP